MQQLVIRFGSQPESPVHWLSWSTEQNEIIASGELPSIGDLSELHDRVTTDNVIVLVSSADVVLTTVELPAKASRKAIQAIPFMLEDEVIGDIDEHFFVLGEKHDSQQEVAIVRHDKMRSWLKELTDAGFYCQKMLPDVLALPVKEEKWYGLQLRDDLILRQSQWSGMTGELSWIGKALENMAKTQEQKVLMEIGTEPCLPNLANVDIDFQATELPMQVLTQQAMTSKFNMLQAPYKLKRKSNKRVSQWRLAAILAGVAVLTTFVDKGIEASALSKQQAQLQEQVIAEYRRAFPDARRIVNVRSQMSQRLQALQQSGASVSMLTMLAQMEDAFNQSELKPQTLRFDSGRGEIRMQAAASSYESFESFKRLAEQQGFTVEQGAINNRNDQVIGSLSIRSDYGSA